MNFRMSRFDRASANSDNPSTFACIPGSWCASNSRSDNRIIHSAMTT
jgi:hypothetical protein